MSGGHRRGGWAAGAAHSQSADAGAGHLSGPERQV